MRVEAIEPGSGCNQDDNAVVAFLERLGPSAFTVDEILHSALDLG